MGVGLFSQVTSDNARGGSGCILGEIPSRKEW